MQATQPKASSGKGDIDRLGGEPCLLRARFERLAPPRLRLLETPLDLIDELARAWPFLDTQGPYAFQFLGKPAALTEKPHPPRLKGREVGGFGKFTVGLARQPLKPFCERLAHVPQTIPLGDG